MIPLHILDTSRMSERLRPKAVDLVNQRILVTDFRGTDQENDLSMPPNCGGLGRVHHFRYSTSIGWPTNPLPIDPACKALKLPLTSEITAQAFQLAVCNWRCWYCFVPFSLLSANQTRSKWVSAEDLVDLFRQEEDRSLVLDLTGGQPDLVPEWIPWMMRELRKQKIDNSVFLWSDDNLSNDYFWRYLSDEDRRLIVDYRKYARVCCFKGFDSESFAFNTLASPSEFDNQFAYMKRLLSLGIDIYAYVTLTGLSTAKRLSQQMKAFVDRLQSLDYYLPLRTIPLEIKIWGTVEPRMDSIKLEALALQYEAIKCWNEEILRRYTDDERALRISEVPLTSLARSLG